jgi:PEP-CTERM motif
MNTSVYTPVSRHLVVAFVAALTSSISTSLYGQAQILVNDNFTNAVRVGAAPSVTGVDRDSTNGSSSNDYVVASNGNGSMATSNGADLASNVATGINGNSFVVTNASAGYSISTHFTSKTLAPLDSISVSLNIRTALANPTGTGAFRVGLFNSAGTQLTANTSNFGGNGVFVDDTGYLASYTLNATSPFVSGQVIERTAGVAANNIFQGTVANLGTAATSTNQVVFDTNYAAVLTITRSADGNSVSITSSFNGVSLSTSDTTLPFTTFDQMAILFGSGFGNATTSRQNFIDDVVVTYTPVPEPASIAALAGLGALGLVAARRRRR